MPYSGGGITKITSSDQIDPDIILASDINSSEFNTANKLVKLDGNAFLKPLQTYPCLEEYSNHLGAIDNFTETIVAGSGTATEDATNHEMDISTTVDDSSSSLFRYKKTWTMSPNLVVSNFIIRNIVNGAGGSRITRIGMANNLVSSGPLNQIAVYQLSNGTWETITGNATDWIINSISAITNGDLITIMSTSSNVMFFVNGTLVKTHTTDIPTVALYSGVGVVSYAATVTVAKSVSIDFMGIKKYV